jgi:hypothetical protein
VPTGARPWRSLSGTWPDLAGKGCTRRRRCLGEQGEPLRRERRAELYLDWLLRAGQYAKAARAFAQARDALKDDEIVQRLEGASGRGVGRQREIVKALPQDSPLLRQQGGVGSRQGLQPRG